MTWSSADAFRGLLEKCGDTVSKGTIEKLTSLAVKDMPYVSDHLSVRIYVCGVRSRLAKAQLHPSRHRSFLRQGKGERKGWVVDLEF